MTEDDVYKILEQKDEEIERLKNEIRINELTHCACLQLIGELANWIHNHSYIGDTRTEELVKRARRLTGK